MRSISSRTFCSNFRSQYIARHVAIVEILEEQTCSLSLGRVVPAPHTRHLLGLFAAIAQNSLLRSFSIVDSLASRQHSCRGSEELAIRKTARFQATPNYSELLRVGGAQELTSSCSELLRATPSGYSELLELSELEQTSQASGATPSQGRPRTPSYSEPIRVTSSTPSSVLELQARKGLPKTACGISHPRL